MNLAEKLRYIEKNCNNEKARQLLSKGEVVVIEDNGRGIKVTVVCQTEGGYKTIITADNGRTYHEVLTKKLNRC